MPLKMSKHLPICIVTTISQYYKYKQLIDDITAEQLISHVHVWLVNATFHCTQHVLQPTFMN